MATFSARIKLRSWRFWATTLLACFALGLAWQLSHFYEQAFYPHTFINGVPVGDLQPTEAIVALQAADPYPPAFTVELTVDQTATSAAQLASTSAQLSAHYDYEQAIRTLFTQVHQVPWHQQLIRLLGFSQDSYRTDILISPLATEELLALVAKQDNQPGELARVTLAKSGDKTSLLVHPGKAGRKLDTVATYQAILAQVQTLAQTAVPPADWQASPPKLTIPASFQMTAPPLTAEEIAHTQRRAELLVSKQLRLKVQTYTFDWNDQQLMNFISPPSQLDTTAIGQALNQINQTLPSHPINAEFEYDPQTLRVTKFSPGKDGLTIDRPASMKQITQALTSWLQANNPGDNLNHPASLTASPAATPATQELTLSAAVEPPAITLDKTNNLGLKQLVGMGESFYAHSIPGRVKNVALTAQRINLTLVKPGEEFSFNQTLGEVSAATGFSPAYVIRGGRTELGDGGGVCQVSSTLFRATMNAGLNITRRLPHSYRVSYYELNSQAGFDATVYAGNVDFRFVNDTPGHLLIATETDSTKLWMKVELYGTADGRTATISDYKSWGATGPLPTQYIPDASLPHGQKRQIDWSAAGLKTSFLYTVHAADGSLKQQETYTSNYRPWAAKYLVGI